MRAIAEHEWAAIGSLFLAGPYGVEKAVKSGLEPRHFTYRALGLAFEVLIELSRANILDRPNFRGGIRSRFEGEENLGLTADDVLAQVFGGDFLKTTAQFHAAKVRDYALLCDLHDELTTAAKEADAFDGNVKDLIAEVNRRISALMVKPSLEAGKYKNVIPDTLAYMEDRYKRGVRIAGIPTGYATLDEILDGLLPGTLHMVAGKTSSGKSTWVGNAACNIAIRHEKHVVLFSLEMKRRQVAMRHIFSEAQVSRRDWQKGLLTSDQHERIRLAGERLKNAPITVEDNISLTLPEMLGYLRQMRFQGECDVAIVDYTQLISMPKSRNANTRQNEVTEIVKGLHALSMELEIPILALSQLNDDGRARESRDIENYAESFLVVEQMEDRKDPAVAEKEMLQAQLVVQKNRDGEVRTIPLMFYPRFTKFVEVDYGQY